MRAIQVSRFGGPEVLELVELPDPVPGPGQEVLAVTSVGINYADTHAADNSYLSPQELPFVPGDEVVGLLPDGRRVCGFTAGGSAYAEKALIYPGQLFDVPPGVSDAQALSLLVQGLTAWHLLRTSARMAEGESVVVHAAAGGVGSLSVQLARLWGAGNVIAVASTQAKRQQALALGAHSVVDSNAPDLTAAIREANGGRRVDIVLEMVGGRTTDESLAALARFGRMVVFGMAGRETATPIPPTSLMIGSRSVIGFWLVDCMNADPAAMVVAPLTELVGLVVSGQLVPQEGQAYPLGDARRAHEDLRARATTGKITLTTGL
ncbi:MAG: zinc-binding dehydrogenase [Actinobacteria bacterium]|nr:zinc-binding dehydrogenase [Actinomycetota bacterium]